MLAGMDLAVFHRVAREAKPGDLMCGLYVIGKGYGHETIYNFEKETETSHRSSLFKGLSVQLRLGISNCLATRCIC